VAWKDDRRAPGQHIANRNGEGETNKRGMSAAGESVRKSDLRGNENKSLGTLVCSYKVWTLKKGEKGEIGVSVKTAREGEGGRGGRSGTTPPLRKRGRAAGANSTLGKKIARERGRGKKFRFTNLLGEDIEHGQRTSLERRLLKRQRSRSSRPQTKGSSPPKLGGERKRGKIQSPHCNLNENHPQKSHSNNNS